VGVVPAAHQNIQSLGAGGLYGSQTGTGGGGFGSNQPVTRDTLDAARMGVGRVPSAEYPDGYLGTIRTRREDRVLDSLKNRSNQRAYQRGVHKGERIDPSDYFYPSGLAPDRGLVAISQGVRQAPLLGLAPAPHLVNDGKADMPNNVPGQIDPRRSQQLARMRPAWK
jgi:hypothetical protein